MNDIIIFTDGSSKGNPGPGGWAAIIALDDRIVEIGGREERTTNNRMELEAAIQALVLVKKEMGNATIYTDSKYLIQGITIWVHNWIRNGWQTSAKEAVINQDQWELLTSLVYDRELTGNMSWKQVSGHVGVPGNERVDEIATLFADGASPLLFNGLQKDYTIDISTFAHDPEKKAVKDLKNSKKTGSTTKAYSYVSLVDGEIQTHQTWAECEARVMGKSGAKFKKTLSHQEEQELIASWLENL